MRGQVRRVKEKEEREVREGGVPEGTQEGRRRGELRTLRRSSESWRRVRPRGPRARVSSSAKEMRCEPSRSKVLKMR